MPLLNYGTLLENIVVFEATRACLSRLGKQDSLVFASSFAMPPLTECWASAKGETKNPAFCFPALQSFCFPPLQPFAVRRPAPVLSPLHRLWSLCLNNQPEIPICPCRGLVATDKPYKRGGPSGSFLAAMLSAQRGRTIHLWVNDDGGRYGNAQAIPPTTSATEVPRLLQHASSLVGMPAGGTVVHHAGRFPGSIPDLRMWLRQGMIAASPARIGFLDPDTYMESGATVSQKEHQEWLQALADGCERVLAVMYFNVRFAGDENERRDERLDAFHEDERALYPQSITFQYGSAAVGIKVRWPASDIKKLESEVRYAVLDAWNGWGVGVPYVTRKQCLNELTVHLDGEPKP